MDEPKSDPIVGYGILVRHNGSVDQMLPAEGNTYYPTGEINHWMTAYRAEPMTFQAESEAQTLADDLAGKFGEKGYRFTVAVCRLVPRWFILHPEWPGQPGLIGSREQIR